MSSSSGKKTVKSKGKVVKKSTSAPKAAGPKKSEMPKRKSVKEEAAAPEANNTSEPAVWHLISSRF